MRTKNRARLPVADSPEKKNPVAWKTDLESCRYYLNIAVNCVFQDYYAALCSANL